ncbi:ribosomal protein subunit Yml6 [Schizosaccharomyces cryophilus OY26]|uniref:Large ribosomal subunit protein uL4m n=1 Tax=Schizosaccharomyces cryophilus (strain OY26 / ATCC MYA-4695 / CBS 11777 / NBRC 106824 / NRRL Y48691) TaxID=653667 RepID=S9W5V5_SCHCR|nr:ribosomal protein subunit Yml6 [Schizosaccharomyces cryophilus OY26]EPY53934.1 ribosomal protein subunit Yml6 [Schizosaccharomyces cryophilus OY26]
MLHLTRYRFPSLEPSSILQVPKQFLQERLRRDILHRAVVYEADADRQGTASTKRRSEINCSGKKMYRQKGTGYARVGDASSPIRRGGAVAHGPKPRDFSTRLQSQVYSMAMRVALSYRFARNELMVLENMIDIPLAKSRVLQEIILQHQLGHPYGRSLFVLHDDYFNPTNANQNNFLKAAPTQSKDVDLCPVSEFQVRDALKFGKLFIDSKAMSVLLEKHSRRPSLFASSTTSTAPTYPSASTVANGSQ